MKKFIILIVLMLYSLSYGVADIFYIDYTNGTDGPGGTVHDGLAEPDDPGGSVYTMIDGTTTSTDTTHAVLAINAFDNDIDDNYNGDYLYNITRSTGVIITDYDADDTDDGSVLIHPVIAGQVATDTFYILRSIKTITEYTTTGTATGIREAGDIAYVRANQTWLQGTQAADIIFDEDGTIDAYISLIGCDATTNDPWDDDSDVKPIIDFESAAYQIILAGDNYWWFERLDFRNSNETDTMFSIGGIGHYIKDCNFQEHQNAGEEGIRMAYCSNITIDGCTFTDCQGASVFIYEATNVLLKNCTYTAGVDEGTNYGLQINGSVVHMEDCTFVATFGTADININAGTLYARNNKLSGKGLVIAASGYAIFSEDDENTFESHVATFYNGTIIRGTASPRSGGADSFAIMAPNAYCGLINPLVLGDKLSGFARIWRTKDIEIDVSVYARVVSAWDVALDAAECYTIVSYLSNAASAARTTVQSTEQITNDVAWTELTSGAFTPLQTGFVYVWFYLAEYDADEAVDVDIKPVVN